MLSAISNVSTFWLAPRFREFEAYEAVADFTAETDSNSLISDQVHIIEDDEILCCKPTHSWKVQPQQDHPRKVSIDLTTQITNPSKNRDIPIVQPNNDEEGMTYEALLLRCHK